MTGDRLTVFRSERIWRLITNFWTLIFIPFLIGNFWLHNQYSFLMAPMSAVYLGFLSLYAGTKEFQRWYDTHRGRHPGEIFVIIWTAVIFILLGISFFSGGEYSVAPEVAANYIMVLTIFALTQQSKRLYRLKKKK